VVPSKTFDKVSGPSMAAVRTRSADDYYAMSGNDLNDLAVLALRFEHRFEDANELRDWQNRLSLMLSRAERVT
jgi:hypothetical protein